MVAQGKAIFEQCVKIAKSMLKDEWNKGLYTQGWNDAENSMFKAF